MSLPRSINIDQRRRQSHTQSQSPLLSTSQIPAGSLAQSYAASRRLSTARLGSPILDNGIPSPRAPSVLHGNGTHASGLRNEGSIIPPVSASPQSTHSSQVYVDPHNPSFTSEQQDLRLIQDTTDVYFNNEDGLAKEGADITHGLKKGIRKSGSSLKRTRSFGDLFEGQRRESSASALIVPGGFRREFIVNKHRQLAVLNDEELKQVPFLTKNFMEFLYIYGHFAGEDFEDEFEDWDQSGDSAAISFDENTPLIQRDQNAQKPLRYQARGTTSTLKAFLIMLKSFVGTGVLFLPRAFSNGGLTFSIAMLSTFGIYSYYCYYILIASKNATGVSSFGDIGAKLYGSWFKQLILFSLILTQIGFACAYIIFTTENLTAFVRNVSGIQVSPGTFFFMQTIIFIPLSFIRNVSKLSLPSLIANFFILAGLLIVLFFTSKEIVENGVKPIEPYINKSEFSLFIGTAIFAFEGIGLIIPVQDSMRHPEKFPLVLMLVIITITIIMVSIATIGYLAYGEDIQTVILLNLPQTNFFVQLIQFFYSLAIMLSTPLQLFPAIALLEKLFFKKSESGKTNTKVKWYKNFARTCLVLVAMNIAFFGANDLDKFVSFVGCFACIPLVYMYPPLLHYVSCTQGKIGAKVLDAVLVVIGLVSMCYTSYQIMFG
ncbi:Vacuolar amino acid transporter 4 [Cyberlindnera fabianii]|uniref:Vacuolar amino acid transporter 4 n=1 Tax=Cyberlindnera fabianii TaxID=36022 RepID=A0A1V2LB81_CYBFA|nr:Vacuolar amino acid transporter 4 [Cyberlindnera fabianii]